MTSCDFAPALRSSAVDADILLKKGRAKVRVGDRVYGADARVTLRLAPRPRVEFGMDLDHTGLDWHLPEDMRVDVHLPSRNEPIPGWATKSTISNAERTRIVFIPREKNLEIRRDERSEMNCVKFHLFNFPTRKGTGSSVARYENKAIAIVHIDLRDSNWIVELRSLPSTWDTLDKLKEVGGCGLTHVGRIRKADCSPFSVEDASDLLSTLRFFLSFARGMWCGPVCPVGYCASRTDPCWEVWSAPEKPWAPHESWFDIAHGEQLAELFPRFTSKWNDPDWRETLGLAIIGI